MLVCYNIITNTLKEGAGDLIVIINDLRETKFYIVAKDELQQFIKNKNIALSEEMQYKGNYETNTKEEIQNVFTDGGSYCKGNRHYIQT